MGERDALVPAAYVVIGAQMYILRKRSGLSQDEAARHLGLRFAVVSRLERGMVGLPRGRVSQLCVLYRASTAERGALLRMWDQVRSGTDPHTCTDHGPGWLERAAYLERRASRVRFGCTSIIPGMFQTDAYAQGLRGKVNGVWHRDPGNPSAAARPIPLRRRGPRFDPVSVVLNGAVLTLAEAEPDIMIPQIAVLRRAVTLGMAVIRVLPQYRERTAQGSHVSELTLSSGSGPIVVSMRETSAGAHYVSDPTRIRDLAAALDQQELVAASPARSLEQLRALQQTLRATRAAARRPPTWHPGGRRQDPRADLTGPLPDGC
ncbi:Scr1 family TA system antitoxin-like transcriptional regulator [Streptacidiphilus sp. P02-A3a]|uniref:Scr1 family TA system antitoxin-like transcriptional regulator n=1 Tax=Streptacidiphilus sp. P02-A3a TaxID=2704468 RepID=UPI0015FB6407|nr:Scr1 family TA system antitoxin-like transcriptional regulator [Streptacidiphilus sp. P02-A3a]QMU70246.1 helix-turn-helix domain-containing protein [Streptacidiphilus sp. P02-A3a]QMU70298.1 helix-turn-helix domain-containing protein [Streptacidiphilus sp. P02-A3a]